MITRALNLVWSIYSQWMSEPSLDDGENLISLHDILRLSAESAVEFQREDGSFPPGRNYTYDESETPVRTTSHWAITFSEVYDITGQDKFREVAESALDYLLKEKLRPSGYTYHCRDVPNKDHCNGLVGQAAPIKALTHAGSILDRDDAIKTAEEVFCIHPFDRELGLWEKVEIDGKRLSFDRTLNHQILFAASGVKLSSKSDKVRDQIQIFLDQLPSNMELHNDGILKHYARPNLTDAIKSVYRDPKHWPLILNELVHHYYSRSKKRKKKEIAYQPVNLRGLAQLRLQFPDHRVWSTDIMQSLNFDVNAEECSNIAHGSIIPGIDLGWSNYAFSNDIQKMKRNLENELNRSLDTNTYLLKSGNVDNIDKSSVISLLVGIPDTTITLRS